MSFDSIPNFPRSRGPIQARDLQSLIQNAQKDSIGVRQTTPAFNHIGIMGDTETHDVIGGLRKLGKLFPFNLNLDLSSTANDVYVDSNISDTTLSEGAIVVDIAQIPDKNLALYLGSTREVDGGDNNIDRQLYALLRLCTPIIITGAASVGDNIWKYFGAHARLTQNPEDDADPVTAHPDAPSITLYNTAEFGNTATKVYNGEVDIDNQLIGIYAVKTGAIVLAVPSCYPKSASSAAGDCWLFDRPNRANMTCPDNLNRLFTPF